MNRTELQDIIIEKLPLKPHGLLKYAPRVGKGRIVCGTIKKNKPKKVLWVTLSTQLRDVDIPLEIQKWLGKRWLSKIDILCYPSLASLEGQYDMIILDEYQEITENNTQNLFNGKLKYEYLLGVTGTHPKHYYKNKILDNLGLEELDSISIDEAVGMGLIAPYKVTTIPVKLNNIDKNVLAGSKTNPFYQTEQANYNYLDRVINKLDEEGKDSLFMRLKRRKFILETESKVEEGKKLLKTLKGRTIIFSGNSETSKKFSKYIYNSKTDSENLDKFQNKEIDILSMVNKGGIGYTYEGVDNFVIVQVDSDKKGNTTQKIARSLLKQTNYTANIYVIYLQDTVDEIWKDRALKEFDPERITEMEKIK